MDELQKLADDISRRLGALAAEAEARKSRREGDDEKLRKAWAEHDLRAKEINAEIQSLAEQMDLRMLDLASHA